MHNFGFTVCFVGCKLLLGEMMTLHCIRVTLSLLALTFAIAEEDSVYTNDFAVEIDGDMTVADLVANSHNLRVVRQVLFPIVSFLSQLSVDVDIM